LIKRFFYIRNYEELLFPN